MRSDGIELPRVLTMEDAGFGRNEHPEICMAVIRKQRLTNENELWHTASKPILCTYRY